MIKWDNSFNIGIPEIDEHHKHLFKICRELELFLDKPNEVYKVDEAIDLICKLREYTTFHFYTEEKIMENIGFDNLNSHKIEHEKLKSEILKLDINNICIENYNDMHFLKNILYDWLFNHIGNEDKKIFEYINKYKLVN
ncbi:MAG: hemerythrin family protein [Clostridium sp.]